MNHKLENKYYLKIPKDFLLEYNIKEFVYKIFSNFERYKGGFDSKGNKLEEGLGIEINTF